MEKTNTRLQESKIVKNKIIVPSNKDEKRGGLFSLTMMRLLTIAMNKVRFWTFITVTLLVVCFSLVSLAILNTKSTDAYDWLNIIILFSTILIVGLGVFLSTSIFKGEINNHLVSLEQREGYKRRDIFGSRLIEIALEASMFMILQTVVNMIVISAFNQMGAVLWYKTYVITLGWYAIMLVLGISVGIFFSSFSIISVARTVAAVILIVMMLFGFISGSTSVGRNDDNPFDNSLVTLKMVRNSRMNDFAKNQLKLKDDWIDQEKDIYMDLKFVKVEDSGKEVLNTENFNSQYQDWIQRYLEINGGEDDSMDELSSVIGAMNAFGGHILSQEGWNKVLTNLSPELAQFLKDTDKYFDNDFSLKYKYTDIMDWNNLGTLGLNQNDYDDDYDGYLLKENLQRIFKEMNNSWYGKKYKVVDYLKDISDSSTLNILEVYPQFCEEGAQSSWAKDLYKDLRKPVEDTKVNPAEIIFNKYVFWALAESKTGSVIDSQFVQLNSNSDVNTFSPGNEAHRTAIGMIWNPLIQFSQMWDGVNYSNVLLNDVLNSRDPIMGGSRTTIRLINTQSSLNKNDLVYSYEREAHVEWVYVGWFIVGCVLIFGAYWIFKKKIIE